MSFQNGGYGLMKKSQIGENFSMADIHGMMVLMLGGFFDTSIPPECTHAVL
jgi:hypothetical protein